MLIVSKNSLLHQLTVLHDVEAVGEGIKDLMHRDKKIESSAIDW